MPGTDAQKRTKEETASVNVWKMHVGSWTSDSVLDFPMNFPRGL